MAKTPAESIQETKRLMGALVRMKPKPHEEMKLGNKKENVQKKERKKRKNG